MSRKIEVYSQKSGYKSIMSSANTWAELKRELSSQGYDFSGQSATENIQKRILNDGDYLPAGEFKVFLRQVDAKGGASTIKINSIEEDPDLLLWIDLNYDGWKTYQDEALDEIILEFQELELNETSEYTSEQAEEFIDDLDGIIDFNSDFPEFESYVNDLRKIRVAVFKEFRVKGNVISDEEATKREYDEFCS